MDGVIVRGRIIQDPSIQVRIAQERTSNQTKDKLALIQPLRFVRISANGLLAKMFKHLHSPAWPKNDSLEYEGRGQCFILVQLPRQVKKKKKKPLTATIQRSSSLPRS